MPPPARHPSRRRTVSRSPTKSPSPDPELIRYLNEQKRAESPESEAFRKQRIAAAGVSNVKSRHQREKEEAERKKLEEEERAARAYKDFVQDMQGDEGEGSARRRGFVSQGGSSSYTPTSRHYHSSTALASAPAAPRAMREQDAANPYAVNGATVLGHEAEEDAAISAPKREPPGKRKRAMDDFLGELQRDQAVQEERLRYKVNEETSISTLLAQEAGGASARPWDSPDPLSSNVCVLNLPANINEYTFGQYFSRYGDLASIKIMWPRIEDPIAPALRVTKTSGCTGFVNFMTRKDAEKAFQAIDSSLWMGNELRTSWGKPLKKPIQPLYYQASSKYNQGMENSTKADKHARRSRSPGSRNRRRTRETSDDPSPTALLRAAVLARGGEEAEERITTVASRVREYGRGYEDMIQKREADNPHFAFFLEKESVEYQYFRILLGEHFEPILPPVPFQDDGEASLYSSDSEEESEWERLKSQEKTKVLGKAAKKRLEAMLRGITLRRERIARIMLFAIEHSAAAETVTNVIIESLLQPTTPLPRKLARLYVVSDVLHNSSASASNAWRYRSLFESKLDKVFLHWGDVSNSYAGRIKRESCKELVRNILNVWENWLVYETSKLSTWREYIESGSGGSGGGVPGDEKIDNIDSVNPKIATKTEDEDIDGEEM